MLRKRMIFALMIVLLCLPLLQSSAYSRGYSPEHLRQAAAGNAPVIWQAVMEKDVFYTLADDRKIYRWKVDGETVDLYCNLPRPPAESLVFAYSALPSSAKSEMDSMVTHIISGDGKLWGLNLYSGKVCEIRREGLRWLAGGLEIDPPSDNDRQFEKNSIKGFIRDGFLYMVHGGSLILWDMSSGRQEDIPLDMLVSSMVPYRDNQALLSIYPAYSTSAWENELIVLNLDDGQVFPFGAQLPEIELTDSAATSIAGLSYDENDDIIYIQAFNALGAKENGMLYRSQGEKEFEPIGYLEPGDLNGFVLSDGRYALKSSSSGAIMVYDPSVTAAADTVSLNIKGLFNDSSLVQAYMRDNPGVMIHTQGVNLNDADITAMITGEADVDIYALYANRLYRSAVDKAYASDLSGSLQLSQSVESMYPAIREALVDNDGILRAYPAGGGMSISLPSLDKKLWRECFGEREYPETYLDLFDLMVAWEEQYADDHDEYNIIGPFELFVIPWDMVYQYIADYEQDNEPINFDTPAFRQSLSALCEAISQIDKERFEKNSRSGGLCVIDIMSLFIERNKLIFGPEDADTAILNPFSFEKGSDAHIRSQVIMLMVNEHSHHKKQAIEFIEYLTKIEHADEVVYYAMHQGMNEAVENPDYSRKVQALSEQIDELNQALDRIQESERQAFESKIASLRYELDQRLSNRWLITQEGIERYHNQADRILPPGSSLYISQNDPDGILNTAVISLCKQLVDDIISQEQFIQSLNGITRKIYFESK